MEGLPRLLYIGDVPVEASTGGALLLHRLLGEYPSEKLRIAELEPWNSNPAQRLQGRDYDAIPFGRDRLVRSRLSPWYAAWLHEKAAHIAHRVERRVSDFGAEGIFTVAHWHAYRTATAVADRNDLPLYLIVHDDMRGAHPIWDPLQSRLTETLGRTYRQAEARFCVSPYMAEAYEEEWGVEGDVLYPHRGPDAPTCKGPPDTSSFRGRPTTIGYAGSMSAAGARRFIEIADILDDADIRFLLFSPVGPEKAYEHGVQHPHIEYRSLIPSTDVVSTLRREVDILIAVGHQRRNRIIRYSFPSKLTDYTATGLPIVLWGPDHWSAIQWAREQNAAEVVTEENPPHVAQVLQQLAAAPERCRRLGRAALEAGRKFFSFEKAVGTFQKVLSSRQTSILEATS